MKRLRILLTALLAIEILGAALLCARRLASIQPRPPAVDLYVDALTARELLALPDQFLFDSAAKWRTLGQTYMKVGFYSKAEACLQQAADWQPRSAEIALTHGYCLERLGILDKARDEYLRATALGNPEMEELAWYYLGRIYLQLEQLDEAHKALTNAGESHLLSVYLRARLLVRKGLVADAQPLLDLLDARRPEDLRVCLLRARAADELGQPEKAADAREAAERARILLNVDIQPPGYVRHPEIGLEEQIPIAWAKHRAGDTAGGAAIMLQLAREENHSGNLIATVPQEAASFQLELGHTDVARRLLEQQIGVDGYPTPRAWELLGLVEAREKHPQQAWQNWHRAERMVPGSVDHNKLADFAQETGDIETAKKHRALALQFSGITAYRANDLSGARSDLQKATSLDRDLADAWFYLGRSERLLGSRTAAESALRNCLKLHPEHGRAQTELDRLAGAASN